MASLALLAQLLAMPDAGYLMRRAEAFGLPPSVVLSLAWQETRSNVSPAVRGAHGEVGRMQILPSTARLRCQGLDVRKYADNVQCGLSILRQLWRETGSLDMAVRRYNGRGYRAGVYMCEVMARAAALERRST